MSSKKSIVLMALIACATLAAGAVVYWATARGTGVSIDSVVYIETAMSARAGFGFVQGGVPATHFPPVYPLLIAISNWAQASPLMYPSTRLLHVVIVCVNTALMGLALAISTRRNVWAVLAGLALFLLSFPVIEAHVMAWSEPPFLTFMLAGFCLFAAYQKKQRGVFLAMAALSFGLAATTRYIGATLIPALGIAVLLFNKKLRDAVVAVGFAALPLALWVIHNALRARQATDRAFAIHLITAGHVRDFFSTLSGFLFPGLLSLKWHVAIVIGACAGAAFLFVWLYKRGAFQNLPSYTRAIPVIAAVFAGVYLPFLAVSISFFDHTTPVDSRVLLPVYACVILVISSALPLVSKLLPAPLVAIAFAGLLLVSGFFNARIIYSKLSQMSKNGWGYGSISWTNSPTMANAISTPAQVKIYSNAFDHINFQMEQERSLMLPTLFDGVTGKTNPTYAQDMQTMCNEYHAGQAVIIYFNAITDRALFPDQKQLSAVCPVKALKTNTDGVVYGIQ